MTAHTLGLSAHGGHSLEPFDTLRDCLPGWTLALTALEGVMGFCDPDRRTIWVDIRLNDRERRCTIMHEAVHAMRGDRHDDPETEKIVRAEAARRLVNVETLCATITVEPHPTDLCAALDVDLDTLETRIRTLDVNERGAFRRATSRLTRPDPARPDLCAAGRWWIVYGMPGQPPCADVHPNGLEFEIASITEDIQPAKILDFDTARHPGIAATA